MPLFIKKDALLRLFPLYGRLHQVLCGMLILWKLIISNMQSEHSGIRALRLSVLRLKVKKYYGKRDLSQPLALITGSEGRGLRQTVLSLCDEVVSIPMKGMVNSLNVSVATAIFVYEVLRQRSYFARNSLKSL